MWVFVCGMARTTLCSNDAIMVVAVLTQVFVAEYVGHLLGQAYPHLQE